MPFSVYASFHFQRNTKNLKGKSQCMAFTFWWHLHVLKQLTDLGDDLD